MRAEHITKGGDICMGTPSWNETPEKPQ